MIRLFTTQDLKLDCPLSLEDKQLHYLFHVMRQQVGSTVLMFNGREGEWACDIIELNKKRGQVIPVRQTRLQEEDSGPALAFSLIKKDNMDLILQKATELGVRRLVPLNAMRSVVHTLNKERAYCVLIEAAEQSERLNIPVLQDPVSVAAFLATCPSDETVVYLSERGQTNGGVTRGSKVCFAVGPEGGWTPSELQAFEAHNRSVSLNLGKLILRAETACLSILACARFQIFKDEQE